jgi:hypothetical protein
MMLLMERNTTVKPANNRRRKRIKVITKKALEKGKKMKKRVWRLPTSEGREKEKNRSGRRRL